MPRTNHNVSAARFVADENSIVRNDGRQIDWAGVGEQYRATPGQTVTASANAAALATAISVNALTAAIPSGTVLNFSPGAGKFAKLTAAAAIGATSIAVEALPTAISAGDTAVHAGSGVKKLKAGTVVGEAASTTGRLRPRVVTSNPATGILATDAVEDDTAAALSGYGVLIGGAIYEALLPEATGSPRVLPSAVKTELNSAGTGFAFLAYSDVR